MRAAARAFGTRGRDRVAASDPGLLRLAAGLRTVGAITVTLAVLSLFGADISHLVAGAIASMVATFAVREKQRDRQAVTLAVGLPVALASVSVAALLSSRTVAGDLFFVALIFCAVYGRRFGDRGTALGLIGFQVYFMSLFVGVGTSSLPGYYGVIAVAFASSAVARFALVPQTPAGILGRLRQAFRARLAQLLDAQLDLLDAAPDDVAKAVAQVREGTARLHETAMMIQGRLDEGTPDESVARLVQRRIADAEIAAERLGLLLLTARSAERADTLTMHLPGAPLPDSGRLPVRDEALETLRRDLLALRLLVRDPAAAGTGTALSQVRNRLLGYRDEENLPKAPPAVQDVFRGSARRRGRCWGCGSRWTARRTSPPTAPRRRARARSWTPRTPRSAEPRRTRRRRSSRRACGGRRRGPPCRWPSARRWPSSAVSCSPRTAGTGRC